MKEIKVLISNSNDIESIRSNVKSYKAIIKSLEFEKDLDTLKSNKKELKKLKEEIKETRDKYFNEMDEEKKEIISLENLIEEKREEIKKIEDELEEEEKKERLEISINYYNENKGEIFEFVEFEKDIYVSTMETKGALLTSGGLTKKVKDLIDDKIKKFNDDKELIGNDETVLEFYKNNGYNVVTALAEVKRIRELEKKPKEDIKEVEEEPTQTPITNPIAEGERYVKVTLEIWEEEKHIDAMKNYISKILDEKLTVYNFKEEE